MDDNQDLSDFAREVDRVLKHLYDPTALRRSPLVRLLGLPAGAGPADLRQEFLAAIEALRPQSTMAAQGKAWRIYQVLFHRFVGQFSQVDVAHTLNLSIRQMAREENRASLALADYLWCRYGVAQRIEGERQPAQVGSPPSQDDELKWLQQSLPTELIAVEETIQAALATVSPLLKALSVTAEARCADPLPRVVGQSSALRQAVLNALTAACRSVAGGTVRVVAEERGRQISICVQAMGGDQPIAPSPDVAESLTMIRRLLKLLGGQLTVEQGLDAQHPLELTLMLPVAQQISVLVIDDNADTLHLYDRYLANTRYLFHGQGDPLQAIALARSLKPQVIVLDVMLPGVDGWELLQRLRSEPATSAIPIVVCSILPEQSLAEAMGAAAYLRKPVSREDFLATLQRVLASPAQESSA